MERFGTAALGQARLGTHSSQMPASRAWMEGAEGPAVFGELPLQSLHLLSAAGRQKQEAGGGVGPGLIEIGLDKGR